MRRGAALAVDYDSRTCNDFNLSRASMVPARPTSSTCRGEVGVAVSATGHVAYNSGVLLDS